MIVSNNDSSGEAIYQLTNAEEMRLKLIKLFQHAEMLSGLILNFVHDKETQKSPNTGNKQQNALMKDQLKLQRSIRVNIINFLKEHSFRLGQLPSKEVYLALKTQRQQFLQEEMNRIEQDKMIQKTKIEELASRQRTNQRFFDLENSQKNENESYKVIAPSGRNMKFEFNQFLFVDLIKVSIDNSNGWVPNIKSSKIQEDLADSELQSVQKNALKVQIQMVEGYLEEALKQDKYEEANLLQKNLNELLDMQEN